MAKLTRALALAACILAWGSVAVRSTSAQPTTSTASTTAGTTSTNNGSSTSSTAPLANTQDELRQRIEERSKELDLLNQQLKETNEKLKTTQNERASLQRDLAIIQHNISQLSLGIKVDETTVQKLSLEIDSLNYNIRDIQTSMENKREAASRILQELQKVEQSNDSLLITFLKNKSLADSVLETQSLANLQSQLTTDIQSLRALEGEYNDEVELAKNNKVKIALHQQNLENKKYVVEDQKEERRVVLAQTKNKESVYLQQLSDLEKRRQEVDSEIEAMDAILRAKIDPSLLPAPHPGLLLWPVPGGYETQGYGATAFAKRTYPGKWHNGVDIDGVPMGTEVLAAADGTVINVGNQDSFCRGAAYGKFIVVKHTNGLTTLYGHLSRFIVSIGQEVSAGNVIGYLGKTGWATGPHLHFTVLASQTLTPARPGFPEGTKPSRSCGPMPVGGDLNPNQYLRIPGSTTDAND